MRLNVITGGTAGAQPIVFVHGLGSSAATWTRCMELLGPRFEVLAVDLLGHGNSPVQDDPDAYTRDLALADLDDVLATLDSPAVLVGHSLGGYLALAHAVTRPQAARAIVVINTGPGFRDPEKRQAWNDRSIRNANKFGVPPQVTNLNLQNDSVVMERLTEIAIPVLVLAGERDRPEYVASGEYLERKVSGARLQVIAGGEHSMHEATHAGEVATAIEDFLSVQG